MDRRGFLTVLAGLTAGCAGLDGRGSHGISPTVGTETTGERTETTSKEVGRVAPTGDRVRLERVTGGLEWPVDLVTPPDRPGRSYVLSQFGEVLALDRSTGETSVVLDLSRKLVERRSWEQGLLGAALHPEFAANRKLYLRYSGPIRGERSGDHTHAFVLSEFRVDEAGTDVDPSSERVVMRIPQPGPVHNGGGIAFGPDGHLYVGVGDGGGGHYDRGPGHAEDWYDALPGGNGQDVTENLLGSILRIDVDGRERLRGRQREYAVPDDNPLVGRSGLDEYYAWGFRNPWRLSFDAEGRLFVGDVGQERYEEVNLVERGGNYGWNVKEGPGCVLLDTCPSETLDGEPLLDPVLSYPHPVGRSNLTAVIGGYSYESDAVAELADRYLFGDFFTAVHGHVFATPPPGTDGDTWDMEELVVANTPGGFPPGAVMGFGTGGEGEVYVLTTRFREGTGEVHRIAAVD